MRLLYITNARIPTEKAHGAQIMQMCEAFARAGADVTFWHARRINTRQMRAIADPWAYYDVERVFDMRALPCLDLFPVLSPLAEKTGLGLFNRIAFGLESISYTLSALIGLLFTPTDLIYTRDSVSLLPLALMRGRKVHFEAHRFPGSRLGRWLHRTALRRIGGVIVLTRALAERFASLGIAEEHIHVAPDGVRLERFDEMPTKADARAELGLPGDAFIVGYVGRFHTMGMGKGLDVLIEAANRLADPELYVCLVGGPGEMVTPLRDRMHKPEALIYLGHVPPGTVPMTLASLDVCVMPSPWNDFFAHYTSPMKLFEYMASGRPIVATDLPATREVLRNGENALLVPPGNPDALADAIRTLRDDPALAERLAAQARRDVEAYTWDARASGILAFVARVTT